MGGSKVLRAALFTGERHDHPRRKDIEASLRGFRARFKAVCAKLLAWQSERLQKVDRMGVVQHLDTA